MKKQFSSNIEKWNSAFLSLDFNIEKVKELLNWTYNNINYQYKLIVVDSPLAMQYAAKAVEFLKEKRPKIRNLNANIGGILYTEALTEMSKEKFEILTDYDKLKSLAIDENSIADNINKNLKIEHNLDVISNVKKLLNQSVGISFNTDMLLKSFSNKNKIDYNFDDAITSSNFPFIAIAEVIAHKHNIENKKFKRFCNLVKEANIFAAILNTEFAIVCKPPIFLNRDRRGRLDSKQDGAVIFADGYKQYYVQGVNFQPNQYKKFFKDKNFTGIDILNLRNVEQKAIIIQEYGYDKILKEVNANIIDTYTGISKITGKQLNYQLFEFTLKDNLNRWGRFLNVRLIQVECHTSHHKVTLGVPINNQTNDCLGAIAWTFGMTKEEYKLNIES